MIIRDVHSSTNPPHACVDFASHLQYDSGAIPVRDLVELPLPTTTQCFSTRPSDPRQLERFSGFRQDQTENRPGNRKPDVEDYFA